MFPLVLRAMNARRAQGYAVLVLCALVVLSAIIAPWYVLTATNNAIHRQIEAAPPVQRIVSVVNDIDVHGDAAGALDIFRHNVTGVYDVRFGPPITGISAQLATSQVATAATITMAYRDKVCEHVVVAGTCPTKPDQVMITSATAVQFGVRTGGSITGVSKAGRLTLTVTGIYRRADPNGLYWSSLLFSGEGNTNTGTDGPDLDTLFTGLDTMSRPELSTASAGLDLPIATADLGTASLGDRIDAGTTQLKLGSASVYTDVGALSRAVAADRRSVQVGVAAALAELLAVSWFALFLATRYTARDRRVDLGLLKLRGAGRFTLIRLSLGQNLVPMTGGLLLGIVGAALAGVFVPQVADRSATTLALSAGATAIALLGTLAAVAVAEWRVGRADVNDLLRKVPARRRGVRADIADLVLVMIAAVATYQGRVDSSDSGLVTVAPAFVAVAVALIAARVLVPICTSAGTAALRAGRVRLSIGLLQVTRRPGIDRVFVLLTIAVALLAITAAQWQSSADVRAARAVIDIGAPRVLTVRPTTPLNLRSIVRAADPGGRDAMAAVIYPDAAPVVGGEPNLAADQPLIAVDAPRLAAVSAWPAINTSATGTSITAAQVAGLVQPKLPPSVEFTGVSLTLDASATGTPDGQAPYFLVSGVDTASGETFQVGFGPLAGRQTVTQPVPECATDLCRISALEITGPPDGRGIFDWDPPSSSHVYQGIPGTSVVIHSLNAPAGPVLTGANLGDVSRWRSDTDGMGLGVSYANDALTMSVTTEDVQTNEFRDGSVYPTDGPIPLPVVAAGTTDAVDQDEAVDGTTLAVRCAAVAPALPYVGGSGLIADLTAMQNSVVDLREGEVFQVWLSADAPASLILKLRAAGLVITADTTIPAYRDQLDQQGPAAALRFQLLAGVVALLLASAALVVVAAAEQKPRADELLALRIQGLPPRSATMIGYGGYVVPALLAIGAGIVGAVLALVLADNRAALFIDAWSVIRPGHGLAAGPLLLVAVAALAAYGTVSIAAGRSMSQRSMSRHGRSRS